MSPPPPVVFIEGEGRNVSWRPADDDQLLRLDGSSGRAAGLRGGGGGSAESNRQVVDGGDAGLIFPAATGGDGEENEMAGEENASPGARAIRVTTGRLEVAGSGSEKLAVGVQDDVWVELAGMLALSASESPAGSSNALASTENPAVEEKPAVSPELLGLMREVVGQQKEMGEERSALMQVRSRLLVLAGWRGGGELRCKFGRA